MINQAYNFTKEHVVIVNSTCNLAPGLENQALTKY